MLYTFLQPVVCVLLVLLTPLSIGITAAGLVLFPAETADFQLRFGPYMLLAFAIATVPMVLWGFAYRRLAHPDRRRLTGLLWGVLVWLYAYHLFVVAARAAARIVLGRNGWAKTRRNAEKTALGAPTALES